MVINGQPLEIAGLTVSSNVFRALGVQPAVGRAYSAEEDSVIGHRTQPRILAGRLGGRRDVLDMTLTADQRTPDGHRRDASRLHPRRSEEPTSSCRTVRRWSSCARCRGRAFVYTHRTTARRGLVRAGVIRDAEGLLASSRRGAAAQRPHGPSCSLPAAEQIVGELRPHFSPWWARCCSCCSSPRERREPAARRSAGRGRELGMRAALGAAQAAGAPDAHRKSGSRGRRRHRGAGCRHALSTAACSRWWAIAFRFRGSIGVARCAGDRIHHGDCAGTGPLFASCPHSSRRAPQGCVA